MTRGRLIFPFVCELHRVDPRALSREPGLDHDFKEPALVDHDDDGVPERTRPEHAPVRIPCQVEPRSEESLRMFGAGNAPRLHLELVFHFGDLERLALVDADGEPLIRVGDRLGALYTTAEALVWRVPTPPGLYAIELAPLGFGLPHRAPRRNLLLARFEDRTAGAPRGGI